MKEKHSESYLVKRVEDAAKTSKPGEPVVESKTTKRPYHRRSVEASTPETVPVESS